MTYVAFTGCSFVSGTGLDCERDIWISHVHKSVPEFQKHTLLNAGQQGATTADIFYRSVDALTNYNCKFLLVSWTEVPRLLVTPSVESYPCNIFLGPSAAFDDVSINNNITIPSTYIKNIRDRLFDLINPHYEFVKILQYTAAIQNLANKLGTRVFFLNSLAPWDDGYFTYITDPARTPASTTTVTQDILDAATRSDEDFWGLYDQIHKKYHETLGLPSHCEWVNMYHSFRDYFLLDLGNDQVHPGVESHRKYAEYITGELKNLLKDPD